MTVKLTRREKALLVALVVVVVMNSQT